MVHGWVQGEEGRGGRFVPGKARKVVSAVLPVPTALDEYSARWPLLLPVFGPWAGPGVVRRRGWETKQAVVAGRLCLVAGFWAYTVAGS